MVDFIYSQDLSEIYEKVSSAVVVIYTEENIIETDIDDTVKNKTVKVLGSGFLISNSTIITAAHVVSVPESINVKFIDGEVIPAKVIMNNKTADVAMIELIWPKKNAVTVSFGDSDKVKIGNRVFIIGSPFDLEQSLSAGYVSGFKKKSAGTNPFTKSEFIQTDAAINTGNSGGPMFNLKGEVIGVVSHITTMTGGFQGIGFAATSNLTANLLLNKSSPWSGADLHLLEGNEAKKFNLPQRNGLLVQRVVFSSPLGVIGVKGGDSEYYLNDKMLIIGGDIILAINDIEFNTDNITLGKLADFARDLKKGDPFEVTVLRKGKKIVLGRR
jgi:serine protease Do